VTAASRVQNDDACSWALPTLRLNPGGRASLVASTMTAAGATESMRAPGIRRPGRMAAMIAPLF
jgi:hypothetical protein